MYFEYYIDGTFMLTPPVATITPEKKRKKRALKLAMKKRKQEAESDVESLELERAEGGRWDSFFVVKMCHFIVVWYNIMYIVHIYEATFL